MYSDPAEQVWVWNYEGEKMYMDIEEPIRFKVLREQFTDTTPTNHPVAAPGRRQSVVDLSASNDLAANSTKIPPYSITVSVILWCITSKLHVDWSSLCSVLLQRMV